MYTIQVHSSTQRQFSSFAVAPAPPHGFLGLMVWARVFRIVLLISPWCRAMFCFPLPSCGCGCGRVRCVLLCGPLLDFALFRFPPHCLLMLVWVWAFEVFYQVWDGFGHCGYALPVRPLWISMWVCVWFVVFFLILVFEFCALFRLPLLPVIAGVVVCFDGNMRITHARFATCPNCARKLHKNCWEPSKSAHSRLGTRHFKNICMTLEENAHVRGQELERQCRSKTVAFFRPYHGWGGGA